MKSWKYIFVVLIGFFILLQLVGCDRASTEMSVFTTVEQAAMVSEGTPNEIKLKYISDNKFDNLRGEELNEAIRNEIKQKQSNLTGNMASQGTTPRRYTDLIGSLCDLTSGSGDKGTPVVFIQGYFDNYSNE